MKNQPIETDLLPPITQELIAEFYALGDRLAEGGEPFEMLKDVYKYVDKFLAECIVPAAICGSGCADCCRIPVEITGLEAAYISANTMFTHVESPKPRIRAEDIWPLALGYCPFLDEGKKTCSIYSVRPMACRVFHAFDDKKFCWPAGQKHMIYTMNSDPKENPIMSKVTVAVLEMNREMKMLYADIRDYFPLKYC